MALEIWTIKKLLEWISDYFETNGVDSPRLSAELLLCHILKLERIQLYTLYDRVVQADQLAALRALVKRGAEQEPIAYLVGRCEFYSLGPENHTGLFDTAPGNRTSGRTGD